MIPPVPPGTRPPRTTISEPIRLTTHSADETRAIGRAVGELLRGGDVVALCGPLGAGKTQFVKGLADGLGVPAGEPVVSPTFVLVREYSGRLKLYHADAYRLGGAEELAALGWDELIGDSDAVVAIEWADRVRPLLSGATLWIEFEHAGGEQRRLSIAASDRFENILSGISSGDAQRPRSHPPRTR